MGWFKRLFGEEGVYAIGEMEHEWRLPDGSHGWVVANFMAHPRWGFTFLN